MTVSNFMFGFCMMHLNRFGKVRSFSNPIGDFLWSDNFWRHIFQPFYKFFFLFSFFLLLLLSLVKMFRAQQLFSSSNKPLTPAVRFLIHKHNLNADAISATGPKGHILKGDVLNFLANPIPVASAKQVTTSTPTPEVATTRSANHTFVPASSNLTSKRKVFPRRNLQPSPTSNTATSQVVADTPSFINYFSRRVVKSSHKTKAFSSFL
eukprot:m.57623 g.57623  ORF g.57623 m.57623 type:complete len:208 (+) comp7832_c1_seq1:426-1049(+)